MQGRPQRRGRQVGEFAPFGFLTQLCAISPNTLNKKVYKEHVKNHKTRLIEKITNESGLLSCRSELLFDL